MRVAPWRAALALVCAALAACAAGPPPDRDPGRGPIGPVFVVHGVWPDHEGMWVDGVVGALHRRGIEAVSVQYATFVLGYLFDYGTDGPAERIAAFVAEVSARHTQTACRGPLRWCGVGFSAGTAVLAKAAARSEPPFGLLYFGGCPLPAWSGPLTTLLESGQVERLVNYYSPIDPVVLWTAGSGVFGFRAGGAAVDRVENRRTWNLHWPVFWTDELSRVVDELADAAEGPAHVCYDDPAYRAFYLDARERLRTGEPAPAAPPARPPLVTAGSD